jgi:Flp pilus assembly pilin Flp
MGAHLCAPIVLPEGKMPRILERFVYEDGGQDVVEYALLVAFVGVAAVAAWLAIQNAIAAGYIGWDGADQDLGAQTPDPQ